MDARTQFKNRSNPPLVKQTSVKKKRDGRTYILLALFFLGMALIMLGCALLNAPVAGAAPVSEPSCTIQLAQNSNHAVYTTTWEGGLEFGNELYFGNGVSTGFDGVSGEHSWATDYDYTVGGLTVYTASVRLVTTSTERSCYKVITIDDLPEPPPAQYKLLLPLVSNQLAPVARMTIEVGPQWNHVTAHLSWEHGIPNTADKIILDWGDGSQKEFVTSDGSAVEIHDYAWPGGTFYPTFKVEGAGGSAPVVVIPITLQP